MEDEDISPVAEGNQDGEVTDAATERAGVLSAYDLDGDGRISKTEAARAELGVIDASLETRATRGGIIGKLAGVAHRILDRFDND